jgi:hypothetical protein
MRWKESYRMPRADNQCLVPSHCFQVFLNQPVLHPVLTDLTILAIGHEIVGVEGYIEV